MNTTISACLIVKNEETCIKQCLDSVLPLCDEVIVYDTGSTDKTKEIVLAYPNSLVKLIEGEWRDDFAWARNQSFAHATKDYIIWVDADDIIDKKSMDFLLKLKDGDLSKYDSVIMPYRYHFDGEKDLYTLDRQRIIKRDLQIKWSGRIHECLPIANNALTLTNSEAYIIHNHQKPYTNRNLLIFKDMDAKGEIVTPRDMFYYANELYDNKLYDDAITWYEKFLKIENAWYVDRLNACMNLYRIYRIVKKNMDKAFLYANEALVTTPEPRADACCAMGDIYMHSKGKGSAKMAIYWYQRAYNNITTGLESTFLQTHYYTTTPLLNLCVLYNLIGDISTAYRMNKMAEAVDPNNPSVLYNNTYFSKFPNLSLN